MFGTSTLKRKRQALNMETFDNVLLNASEFIKGRLFFVSVNTNIKPKSTPSVHYFSIDNELCYDSFYLDFGPLNLAMLYHYCVKLRKKLNNPDFSKKKIVHCTGSDIHKRVNAAFLIGAYSIIYLDYEPEKAYEVLNHDSTRDYMEFRDASVGEPYNLSLIECLRAIKKAHTYGFFNFDNFDFLEYEHYERVEHGDFNWIVPNKFIAFCGPQNRSRVSHYEYPVHSPETYFAYFRRHKVSTIIRLNKKSYDSNKFVQAGFEHKDLYFVDGGIPSDRILQNFITICESAEGAIAVHCKAGLGRTGSLIACYIMKHWKFTAEETIAWIRICRPGSIIGHQQSWLQDKQKQMWEAGDAYRKKHGITTFQKFSAGIYSMPVRKKSHDNVTGIMRKVDCMEINDPQDNPEFEETKETQGDKLKEIKAQRCRTKLTLPTSTEREKLRRVHVTTTTTTTTNNQTILRSGKVVNAATRITGSSSTRVMTKRIEVKETPARKIATTRKLTTPIVSTNDKLQLSEKRPIKASLSRQNGLNFKNGHGLKIEDKPTAKRTKRALALEKDKSASPRSVKVLRRSHVLALSFKDDSCNKSTDKLCLPSVKMNKTL